MATKVLILGVYGFIGRHLAEFLSGQGYQVFGIGHKSDDSETLLKENFIHMEINEANLLLCCPDPDVIINCAGGASVPVSFSQPFDDFQKTSLALFAGLELIRKNRLNCLYIFTSSGAVYGNQRGILSEHSITENQVSPYGVYKKCCEQICLMYHQQFGLNVSVLRLFSVYGAGLTKQLLWDACHKIKKSEHSFFGSGEEVRDWVHIDDICQLYLSIIERPNKTGFFLANGGTGIGTKVKAILKLIYQEMGNRGTPYFTQSQREGDPNMFIADISIAQSIGWNPHIFPKQGVSDYTQWFKEKYLL